MDKILRPPITIIIFFLTAFLTSFIVYSNLWPNAPILGGDSFAYIDLAQKLKNGSLNAPHDRLIGYPLLLILTGSVPNPTRILYWISIIMHFLSISMLAYIVYDLGLSIILIYIFLIVLLLPPYTESAAYVLTENFTEFILALMVFVFYLYYKYHRKWMLILCGIFCSVSFTIRPTYIVLAFALIPILLFIANYNANRNKTFMKKYVIPISLLIIPTIITLGTYVIINYKNYGYLGITPKSGFMLFTRTIRFLERIPDKDNNLREILIENRNKSLTKRNSSHKGTQFIWGKAGSVNKYFYETTGKKPEKLANEMLNINIKLILSAPLEYLQTVIETFATIWMPSITKISQFNSKIIQALFNFIHLTIITLFIISINFFVVTNAITFLKKWGINYRNITIVTNCVEKDNMPIQWLCVIIIMYTAIISSIVDVGDPRYLKPVIPIVMLSLCIFLDQWKKSNINT